MRVDPRHLLPRPKRADALPASWRLPRQIRVRALGIEPDDPALERLRARIARLGGDLRSVESGACDWQLSVDPALELPPQGYKLRLDTQGLRARAVDAAGLAYALATLDQWLVLHELQPGGDPRLVTGLELTDHPDLLERGAMLDVARDRVPTSRELFALVERLAAWKLNRLQLYMEASFAYPGHERVWADASPLRAEELTALDAFCRARHIELVPNQQSFGHLHKWLAHEPYRELAECPEGVEHPFSPQVEPFSLCPSDPRALAFLEELYDALLPCFASRELNVGLDETFDLGRGRSRARCEERGRHHVYLDFLKEVHGLVAARGRRMQFWGDIVLERPELIPELPGDAIAMAWGYEAEHPFERQLEAFRESGLEFHACPGTSSWNSVVGRVDNALENLARAARAACAQGARGVLVTDWGDRGHLQPPPISEPGWLAGAELAWNAKRAATPAPEGIARALDRFAFEDPAAALGRALVELGRTHLPVRAHVQNGTAPFFLLAFALEPLPHPRLEGLAAAGLERVEEAVEASLSGLDATRARRPDADLVCEELRWAGDLVRFGCRLGRARLAAGERNALTELPAATRAALAAELGPLAERHRGLWTRRSRPGGLARSAAWLERLLPALGDPP